MTKSLFLIVVSILFFASSASAAPPVIFYDDVPVDLVQWVEGHLVRHFKTPPRFAVVDNDAAILRHETRNGIAVTSLAAESDGALYLSVKATVHLQDDLYRGLLVHELVHILQNDSGRRYACANQREAEAYALQNRFLEDHDLPPVMDTESLMRLHNCAPSGIITISD